jgi:hypothetical protein
MGRRWIDAHRKLGMFMTKKKLENEEKKKTTKTQNKVLPL